MTDDAPKPPRRGRVSPPELGAPAQPRNLAGPAKSARGKKLSSKLWIERQLSDPYVARARLEGYRSRAAYKLKELDARHAIIRRGARVIDLGAAPGGWTQVALERGAARVVGIDLLAIAPISGAHFIRGDFLSDEAPGAVREALGGPADVVLCDMAANTTGHRRTDHLRTAALAEAGVDFAIAVLAPGGAFVAKVFQGGSEADMLRRLKERFKVVRHVKPPASRSASPELYVVATGFKGA